MWIPASPWTRPGPTGPRARRAALWSRIEGDFFNVMGLPLCRLGQMLKEQGVEIL